MKRREFIKLLASAGIVAPFAPYWLASAEAADSPVHTGPLVVFLNLQGAWDPAMFCDPRPAIRNGFSDADIATEGEFRYAPLNHNDQDFVAEFFARHYQEMVVVNGINMQTNAHVAGITNAFQGTFATGYPTLSAAYAAAVAPGLPMSYMVTGNYKATGDLLPYTAVSQASLIQSLARPNVTSTALNNNLTSGTDNLRMPDDVLDMVFNAQGDRRNRLLSDQNSMPRWRQMLQYYDSAVDGSQAVESLGNILPHDGFQTVDERGVENEFVAQADIFLHAMAAGLTVSVDAEFTDNRFDTHDNHDVRQTDMLARFVYGVKFMWDRAAVLDNRWGTSLVDRLQLVIVSDFGRTPEYNSDGGTDHWPTSSAIVMSESFGSNGIGNRVVGLSTDEGGYGSGKINPATLQEASAADGGVELTSSHLHLALRRHLGIHDNPVLANVGFLNTETVEIFSTVPGTN